MAKNKPIEYHRITGRHNESPDRIKELAKKIVESKKDKEVRFLLSDQSKDNINKVIKESGYGYRINPAKKYDPKNFKRGAKLRLESEKKAGVKYHRIGSNDKVRSASYQEWSNFFKKLQDTKPKSFYEKRFIKSKQLYQSKLIGKATTQYNQPKEILLDNIRDTDDPEKFQAGLDFVEDKIKNWEKVQKSQGSKDVKSWLNNKQLKRFETLKGETQELHPVAGWSHPEGTLLTKDFDSKTLNPELSNYEYFTEKGTEGVDKLDFDPNPKEPKLDEFDELPQHDFSEINKSDESNQFVDESVDSLELRTTPGVDPDRVKGQYKVHSPDKNQIKKVARAFVKSGYKSDISKYLEGAKDSHNLFSKRTDVPPKISDNVIAQITENKIPAPASLIKPDKVEITNPQILEKNKKILGSIRRKNKKIVKSGNWHPGDKSRNIKPNPPPKISVPKHITNVTSIQSNQIGSLGRRDYLFLGKTPLSVKPKPVSSSEKRLPVIKKLKAPDYKKVNVTTEVTPIKKKSINLNKKPSKKVPTPLARTVAQRITERFKTKGGTPNIEYKHRPTDKKHGKHSGKGIKFTRGIGVFSGLSSITGILAARKQAQEWTGEKEPGLIKSLQMMYPQVLGLPKKKGVKYFDDPI